jgi:hypothetical protein
MPGFRPFFNPATGEWIQYAATAEDNGGEFVRFDWRSAGGIGSGCRRPREMLDDVIETAGASMNVADRTAESQLP